MVYIDIHPVDYDGNLFDACQWAPRGPLHGQDPWSKLDPTARTRSSPSTTCRVHHRHQDGREDTRGPSLDEEEVADARLTVSTDQNGDLRAMQKGLSGSFSVDEVKYIVGLSRELGKKVRPSSQSERGGRRVRER